MAENEKAVQAKKEKKTDKTAKPGFFARVGKWLRDMKSELKKVQWPTRKQTINNTLIVIACVIVVGVCIGLFDLVAQQAIGLLLGG
ncbi:MAG: preprotein translocase subunit SecE [Lawsonibacter sp.]|nr:preprotein translocase subunit SecE [Lawsonibacter sp.]